jgi:hypothetical protein
MGLIICIESLKLGLELTEKLTGAPKWRVLCFKKVEKNADLCFEGYDLWFCLPPNYMKATKKTRLILQSI